MMPLSVSARAPASGSSTRQRRPCSSKWKVLRPGPWASASRSTLPTAVIDTRQPHWTTSSLEIHLERKLVDKRVFPAIDINKSGARKEELLLPKEELNRVWILRKALNPLSPVQTMERLLDKLSKTRSNGEFLASMSG